MANVNGNITLNFDGVTSFKVDGHLFQWGTKYLQYVDLYAPATPVKTVTLNFSSFWTMNTLDLSGNIRAVIKDLDDTANRAIKILDLTGAVGTNVIELKSTSINHLLGGDGVEQVTLGNGYYQSIQLGNGNNVLKTGVANVETVTMGSGNDAITVGSGYIVSLVAGGGNNTVTVGTGEVEFLFTGSQVDKVTTSTGYVGLIDTGRGADTVTLGSGGAGSVVLSRDADTVILSKLTEPDTVLLGGGESVSDASQKDSDTVDFSKFTANFTIDIREGATIKTGNGNFIVRGFENAVGGSGSEIILGNDDANILKGNAGNDRLAGGLGADTLFGGTGKDTYVFDTKLGAGNVDTVDDFIAADDVIWLDDDVFTKVGKTGDLASAAFWTGSAAHEADDRIIYDKVSGKLFYDADGNGSGAAVQFALLDKGLTLTNLDFLVIA